MFINIRKHISANSLFFRSTLGAGIPIGLIIALIGLSLPTVNIPTNVWEWVSYFLSYLPAGIVMDILYKEIVHKEKYYFYYNMGITKIELWVVSILLSYSFYLLSILIISVWKIASK